MKDILLPLWLCTLTLCRGENNTVRYEPLKNKDLDEEYKAWAKGSDYYVRSYGLSFEWVEVTTEDHLTIKIHHMWNPIVNGTKIPVVMITGFSFDGDIFLLNRPEDNFAMLCANQGYDVFLASFRSSLSYVSSKTSKQILTNFTIDDTAYLDIPAVIDHVLELTKQPKVHLVAPSKGATAALELLASKTEYNAKIGILVLISPITYIGAPSPYVGSSLNVLKILTYIGGSVFADFVDKPRGVNDSPRDYTMAKILQFLVNVSPVLGTCVINWIFAGKLDCSTKVNFDLDMVEKLFTRAFPQKVSLREMLQYAENTDAGTFQSYSTAYVDRDLAALLFHFFPNTKKFSLERVSCPVIILQPDVDTYSQPQDFKRIRNELCSRIVQGKLSPNKYVFRVNVSNYQHFDPSIARNNYHIYGAAFYMILREFDTARDSSLQRVLGYIDADFSHLQPQTCE